MINAPGLQVSTFAKFLIADTTLSRISVFIILMLFGMPAALASGHLRGELSGKYIATNPGREEKVFDKFNNLHPLLSVKGPDLPNFIAQSIPAAKYDQKYYVSIKLSSAGKFDTKISAVKKPEWLSLRTGPFVQTMAGTGLPAGADNASAVAPFRSPYALAADAAGNTYIADKDANCIRKMDTNGKVTVVAGGNEPGYLDGAGTDARFDSPSGIAVDQIGNVYVSDQNNNCIRKIDKQGMVSTLSGDKSSGYADGTGNSARFKSPAGLALSRNGHLYVADSGNSLIRVISPTGEVTTLAGNGKFGFADGKGPDAAFSKPVGISVGTTGDIYVCDQLNNRIRKVSIDGKVTTLAGSGIPAYNDGEGVKSAFNQPAGITSDGSGGLFVTDQLNHLVRRVGENGRVSTVAGSQPGYWEGTGNFARFNNPTGICFNNEGDILVGDLLNLKIRQIVINPVLSGTPGRSDVGISELILQAEGGSGNQLQTLRLSVLDEVPPQLVTRSPANKMADVDNAVIPVLTFNEPVMLSDTGSITVIANKQIFKKYNLGLPEDREKLILSSDGKTLKINSSGVFPGGSNLAITVGRNVIMDGSGNAFEGLDDHNWSFSTKAKKNQALNLARSFEKVYGDSAFILGPAKSSSGLPVIYSADDASIVAIEGNYARILKAGSCRLTATQEGNEEYNFLSASGELTIHPRKITIQPAGNQSKIYGEADPDFTFKISSGDLLDGHKFKGSLDRIPGDSCGVYNITSGDLSLGNNYTLLVLPAQFEIKKAPIGQKDSTPTLVSGNAAKKDSLFWENENENVLNPILAESPSFSYKILENQPSNTLAGRLSPSAISGVRPFVLKSTGSVAPPFKIQGDSILTTMPLDFETEMQYTLQLESLHADGTVKRQSLKIEVADVNERPSMDSPDINEVCTSGTIVLQGIIAGPERDQTVKASIKTLNPGVFKFLTISEVTNGEAAISYSLLNKATKKAIIQIILQDNGGVANGGIDSNVFDYEVSFAASPQVSVTSNKDAVSKGEEVLLTATGSGKFSWFNKEGVQVGYNSPFLRVSPTQTDTYTVRLLSESGCVSEVEIKITVRESVKVVCYNFISPNDDGKNDVFIVKNIDLFPQNRLVVYDKAGKVVFDQKGYTNDWKATYKGMTLPEATYYYVLDLGPGNDKLKGAIAVAGDW